MDKNSVERKPRVSRRRFLQSSAAATVGASCATSLAVSGCNSVPPATRAAETAVAVPSAATPAATIPASAARIDTVALNRTGRRISRLGLGTGSDNGQVQRAMGQAAFNRMVKYAFERGVSYIDTAENYGTHELVGASIRELPREQLFIQTKMPWHEFVDAKSDAKAKVITRIERYLRELGTDYLDSLLIHCTTRSGWDAELAAMMEGFDEAQRRGLIRLKGVSCHGLPALQTATRVEWVEVHLARINPQGRHVDGRDGGWGEAGDMTAAMREITAMHRQGRGVIGMKLIGNGDDKLEERHGSVAFRA